MVKKNDYLLLVPREYVFISDLNYQNATTLGNTQSENKVHGEFAMSEEWKTTEQIINSKL